jgi:hypothetical protein
MFGVRPPALRTGRSEVTPRLGTNAEVAPRPMVFRKSRRFMLVSSKK